MLTASAAGETIIGPGGESLPVTDAGGGFVERLIRSPGQVELTGWSAGAAGAAERVLVFADGHLVAAPRPSVERPDVAKIQGPGALMAGFSFTAPTAADPESSTGEIRVFGLLADRAIELQRLRPVEQHAEL